MFNRENEDNPRMVSVNLRFKIGSEEVGPVENYLSAILAASGAELLEWTADYPTIRGENFIMENSRSYSEGGCGYSVQS